MHSKNKYKKIIKTSVLYKTLLYENKQSFVEKILSNDKVKAVINGLKFIAEEVVSDSLLEFIGVEIPEEQSSSEFIKNYFNIFKAIGEVDEYLQSSEHRKSIEDKKNILNYYFGDNIEKFINNLSEPALNNFYEFCNERDVKFKKYIILGLVKEKYSIESNDLNEVIKILKSKTLSKDKEKNFNLLVLRNEIKQLEKKEINLLKKTSYLPRIWIREKLNIIFDDNIEVKVAPKSVKENIIKSFIRGLTVDAKNFVKSLADTFKVEKIKELEKLFPNISSEVDIENAFKNEDNLILIPGYIEKYLNDVAGLNMKIDFKNNKIDDNQLSKIEDKVIK